LSSTHWVSRAFFLVGVVSGCLSVYYACVLQRIVGKLYKVDSIRDWLRLPLRRKGSETFESLRPSLAAVIIDSAPFTMVKVSIFAFLTGLTIYEGFTWTRALDTSAAPGDSKYAFVVYMIGTGICSVFFLYSFLVKAVENHDT